MPKMKTNRGASKRFRRTASGRFKHRASNRNHILTKKQKKRKKHLRQGSLVSKRDQKSVERMLNKE